MLGLRPPEVGLDWAPEKRGTADPRGNAAPRFRLPLNPGYVPPLSPQTPGPAMPKRRLANRSSRTRHSNDAISITPSAESSTYCPFCQYSRIMIDRPSDPGL